MDTLSKVKLALDRPEKFAEKNRRFGQEVGDLDWLVAASFGETDILFVHIEHTLPREQLCLQVQDLLQFLFDQFGAFLGSLEIFWDGPNVSGRPSFGLCLCLGLFMTDTTTLWSCQNSYRKSPFLMEQSTENGDFP